MASASDPQRPSSHNSLNMFLLLPLVITSAFLSAHTSAASSSAAAALSPLPAPVSVPVPVPVISIRPNPLLATVTGSIKHDAFRSPEMFPRRDPLNSFQLYADGFNIKDQHYWSSVIFTGIWAFGMAFVCLSFGIATSIWWFSEDRYIGAVMHSHSNFPWRLYYVGIVQFSIIAITSVGVIYWGSYESNKQIKESTDVILSNVDQVINQVEHAIDTVEGVTSPLMSESLNKTIHDACDKMNNTAKELQSHFRDGKAKFNRNFMNMKILLASSTTIIPTTIFIGIVAVLKVWCKILRICFLTMAVVLFVSWFLAGICFVLSNIATDACQAMRDYNENPESSSFSKLLPCLNATDANKSLDLAKFAIKNLLSQMNGAIDIINEREKMMRDLHPTGPYNITLKHFCDPFGPPPDYQDIQCSPNYSNFSTFEMDYVQYRCDEDIVRHCFEKNTPIPNTYYSQFLISISTSQEVIKNFPSLYDIMTCNFIKVAFQSLTTEHCNKLQTIFNTLWIGFAIASIAMMSLQIIWFAIRKHLAIKNIVKFDFMCYSFGLL